MLTWRSPSPLRFESHQRVLFQPASRIGNPGQAAHQRRWNRKSSNQKYNRLSAAFAVALVFLSGATMLATGFAGPANAAKKKTPPTTIPAKAKSVKVAGAPVVVGWISQNGAGTQEALLAEQFVNINGGVSGRPLKLATCSTKGNATSAKSCANQLLGKKVKLVLEGPADANWSAAAELFRASKTLVVGHLPLSATEYTDPNAVYLASAASTVSAATGVFVSTVDNPRAVAVLVSSESGSKAGLALALGPLRAKGLQPIITTLTNGEVDATAIGSALSAATEAGVAGGGPSAVIVLASPEQCLAVMEAAKAQAFAGRLITTDACATPATLEAAGDNAEGWVVLSAQPNAAAQATFQQFSDYVNAATRFKIKRSTDPAAVQNFASVVNGVSLLGKLEKSVLDATPAVVGATVKSYLGRAEATSTYAQKPYAYKRSKLFPSVAGFTVFASQWSGGRFVEAPGGSKVDGFLG
jgi:branched-chain amino acid transport system substrate-binding protein